MEYIWTKLGSLGNSKNSLFPSAGYIAKEKRSQEIIWAPEKNRVPPVDAVAFFLNKLSCMFLRIRSSDMRINIGMLLTKVVSSYSV